MKNIDLSEKYDDIYKKGASSFFTYKPITDYLAILEMEPQWQGLEVLEIGCGKGELAAMMHFAGCRKVDAIDFSKEAISLARKKFNIDGLTFIEGDYRSLEGRYDLVVMNGVLEHFDHPFEELSGIIDRYLKPDGAVITSSPSFLNPRGYVWMTLQLLFDVPMSLTDLHFLCPFDFEEFAEKKGLKLTLKSTNQQWGSGAMTIADFDKRLRNALRDAGMPTQGVDRFLDWLQKAVRYHCSSEYTGAVVIYRLDLQP